MAVTAPANADEIGAGLKDIGFEVSQRVTEIDPLRWRVRRIVGQTVSLQVDSREYESTY